LAKSFRFRQVEQYDDVFEYGDVGDLFYLIIKGSVSVQIPNPEIKKWDILRKEFLQLKKWKSEEMDERIEQEKTKS
jgi:CRP-like cAMP-binding protein